MSAGRLETAKSGKNDSECELKGKKLLYGDFLVNGERVSEAKVSDNPRIGWEILSKATQERDQQKQE